MLRFIPVFAIAFLLSFNYGALLYVNSSYLGNYFLTNFVSILFLIGALGNVILFLIAPRFLSYFGKKRLLFLFLLTLLTGTLGMALGSHPLYVGISFVIFASTVFMVYYCLDIFLEEESSDKRTGRIRGIYLTTVSIGIALGPLLLPLIILNGELRKVYLFAAGILIIPIAIIFFLPHTKLTRTSRIIPPLPFRTWWKSRSLRAVTLAKLSLEIFFALMVIYTPIYLHDHIGFAWSSLGIVFTIALLPFILLEWPAGVLADRLWGEKEMMTLGFFITGVTLVVMPFLGAVIVVWTIILFLSRVGASLVEIMTESYFFKKINHKDTGLLSIFRLARPGGIISGALIGTVSLNLFSFEKIFFVVAIVIFFGMREALYIRDTL